MDRIAVVLLAVVLSGLPGSAAEPEPDYMPLAVGSFCEYRMTAVRANGDKDEFTSTVRLKGTTKLDGKRYYGGILRIEAPGVSVAPELVHMRRGDDGYYQRFGMSVETPLRPFDDCLKVSCLSESNDESHSYYAPGIGRVKHVDVNAAFGDTFEFLLQNYDVKRAKKKKGR